MRTRRPLPHRAQTLRVALFTLPLALPAGAGVLPTPPKSCALPVPIVEYRFDESGTSAQSTGSDVTAAIFRNADSVPVDLHGAPGSGVSGSGGDRAFDNSDPTPPSVPGDVGMAGYGGRAEQPVDSDAVDSFASMTLTGWFKSDDSVSVTGNLARLFDKSDGAVPPGAGWWLAWSDAGALNVDLRSISVPGGVVASVTSAPVYFSQNEWIYFAVSFDSATAVDNVRFYRGTRGEPTTLVESFSVEIGPIADAGQHLTLANGANGVRAFQGLLDNLRVFGSTTDSTGVLNPDQIEALRRNDLAPVPITEYLFDESGTSAPSTGSDSTSVVFRNAAEAIVDLHGADGSGVSGLAGDRAFDNSSPTPPAGPGDVGMAGYGGRAEQPVDDDLVDSFSSVTMTGWLRGNDGASVTGNHARLYDKADGIAPPDGGGWTLAWSPFDGQIGFSYRSIHAPGGVGGGAESGASYFSNDAWIFYAVTLDATATADNLLFYRGTADDPAALVGTTSAPLGPINDAFRHLTIGNSSNAVRSFVGLLDAMRIYGSTTDTAGVLSLEQIEALRAADVEHRLAVASDADGDGLIDGCDATPPVIEPLLDGPLGNGGWYVGDALVEWQIDDPESPVTDAFGCEPTTVAADTAETTLVCEATSDGGTAEESVTLKRDATPPVATASAGPPPNANGWRRNSVTVSFSGVDALSGGVVCDPQVVLSAEGAGQSASGSCTDAAGNESAPATAADIAIDKTAPTIAIVTPAPSAIYHRNELVLASFSCGDALSGVATCTGQLADGLPLPTSKKSNKARFTVVATDLAGNTTRQTVTYTVR